MSDGVSALATNSEPTPAQRSGQRRRSTAKRIAIGGLWLLGCAVLLVAGAFAFLLWTEPGRSFAARRLEAALSQAIPGSIAIGTLERLQPGEAVLSDLRFLHPDGSVVLRVQRAEIALAPFDLMRGHVHFERARIDGGELTIAVQPDGRTSIEAVFDDPGASKDKSKGPQLDLRSMHVENLTLLIKPDPKQTFRLRDVQGFVAVHGGGSSGVQVSLDRIRAHLVKPEVLGQRIEILRADGWVHGGAQQILKLDFEAALEDDRFGAALAYHNRKQEPVVLELDMNADVETQLAALGAELRSWLSDTIDVRRK